MQRATYRHRHFHLINQSNQTSPQPAFSLRAQRRTGEGSKFSSIHTSVIGHFVIGSLIFSITIIIWTLNIHTSAIGHFTSGNFSSELQSIGHFSSELQSIGHFSLVRWFFSITIIICTDLQIIIRTWHMKWFESKPGTGACRESLLTQPTGQSYPSLISKNISFSS